MTRKKGYYSISAVAEMVGLHQQTIRMYEREGFINPKRSDGNTRMFTEEDVQQLELVIYYTNKLGVNLAGVEVILQMQKKIEDLQKEINGAFAKSKDEIEKNKIEYSQKAKQAALMLQNMKKHKKKVEE